MKKKAFIWIILTYTYYQTCGSLISASIGPVLSRYENPLYSSFGHNLKIIDHLKKGQHENAQNIPYNHVIENLRNDWQMPSVYLQKRGYLNKIPKNVLHDLQEDLKNKNEELFSSEYNDLDKKRNPIRKTSREIKNKNEMKNLKVEKSREENSALEIQQIKTTTTTPKPGFLAKVKNIFHRNNSSALVEEEPDLKDLSDSTNLLQNDYYQKLYDNIALEDPTENLIGYTGVRKSKLNGISNYWPLITHEEVSYSGSPSHNIFEKDLNTEELYKNLSQADVEYVKNFLKCYKENKSKFLIDYLHVSPSPSTENETATEASLNNKTNTLGSNSTVKDSAFTPGLNTTKQNNTNLTNGTKGKESGFKNLTVVPSLPDEQAKTNSSNENTDKKTDSEEDSDHNNSTEYSSTGCISTQNVSVHNPIKSNESINEGISYKLKFLAHIHHAVSDIGKGPRKPIDLKKIQKMIDDARHNNPAILGDDNSKNCTPIRLNNFTLDFDIQKPFVNKFKPGDSHSDNSFEKHWTEIDSKSDENNIISQFLKGGRSQFQMNYRIQSPYADNFLDPTNAIDCDSHSQDIDKGSHFLAKFFKKRETAPSEEEILSDISSSLNKLKLESSKINSHHDDDYSEKDKGDSSNAEDDYNYVNDDLSSDNTAELRHSRKGKKKKKINKAQITKNGKKSGKSSVDTGSGINQIFSDFQDIKFRINPEQENAIQTFIESLNSPPEVFNFDVNRYIKQTENKVDEQFKSNAAPQKKYYEFINIPSIENEQIPLLQSNKELNKENSKREEFNPNQPGKRDLLRQYIKGITSRLTELGHPLEDIKTIERGIKEPDEDREENTKDVADDSSMLVPNYAGSCDKIYKNKLENIEQKSTGETDDFLDNFYLLNDGTSQIYKPQAINSKTQYDPDGLQIDLDLNKKFKDLTLTTGAFAQPKQKNQKRKDLNP